MLRRQIYQNHVNSAFSAPKTSATDSVGGRKKSGCDATVASVKSGRLEVERSFFCRVPAEPELKVEPEVLKFDQTSLF